MSLGQWLDLIFYIICGTLRGINVSDISRELIWFGSVLGVVIFNQNAIIYYFTCTTIPVISP